MKLCLKELIRQASIEVLINKLKIRKENTIACGDGYNDISMVKYAGIGVAMENAVDEVKQGGRLCDRFK